MTESHPILPVIDQSYLDLLAWMDPEKGNVVMLISINARYNRNHTYDSRVVIMATIGGNWFYDCTLTEKVSQTEQYKFC